MNEILIHVLDKDYQDEISTLFNISNYEVAISYDLNEAISIAATELLDLVMIWPADYENTKAFINELNKNDLGYLPVLTIIVDKTQVQKISSLPITDYLLLPAPKEEFYAIIQEIIKDIDVQSTIMEGMHWQGSLEEYNMIDLFQMIDESKNDAELILSYNNRNANIHFKEGKIINAELMNFSGEAALHKLVFWSKGNFQIKFHKPSSLKETIQSTNQEILLIMAHDLSEFDQIYRGLPGLYEDVLINPFIELTDISAFQKKILSKCRQFILIFDLILEFKEENKIIVQEVKNLVERNFIGKRNEIEALIIQESKERGLNKIINTISSVFKKKSDIEGMETIQESQYLEESFAQINFEHSQLEEIDKRNIRKKIESLN